MADQTEAEIVEALAIAAAQPKQVGDSDKYTIVPQGYCMLGLESYKDAPDRIKASPIFQSLDSFIAYVKKHYDKDTAIFLDTTGAATAILDYHGRELPTWGSHKASYVPKKSERWDLWTAACKRSFTQRELAEFIEDNIADFLAPTGGDMLTTAKTLQIKKDVRFKSDVRLENGDVNLEYEEVTKAGRGELPIPTEITIAIPILEAEEPRDISVRLKYRLDQGAVTFSLAIKQQQALLDAVRRYIYATIKNDLTILPFLGQP